jgi:predicted RNase H-like nuclease (RuvC/YqgF family)
MRDIKELSELLGWSKRQVGLRITDLNGLINKHIQTGKHGKTLVDDTGFQLLRRLKELEDKGMAVKEAVEQMKAELQNEQENKKSDDVNLDVSSDLVNALYERIESLESQLKAKDKEIERLHDLLSRQLPGKVAFNSNSNTDTEAEVDIHYLQDIVMVQRKEIEELREILEEVKKPWWQRWFRRNRN